MRREKKISGSVFAKIVAYFILGISTLVGVGALCGVILMFTGNVYDYQSQEKCVQAFAREMMVSQAWDDLHTMRDLFDKSDLSDIELHDWDNHNYRVEIYEDDLLLWSNYDGYETAYSFRYNYNLWVEEFEVVEETIPATDKTDVTSNSMIEITEQKTEVHAFNREYSIRLYVNPNFPCDDAYMVNYNRAVLLCQGRYAYPIVLAVCVFVMLICFIFLMYGAGHRNGREGITPGILTALHFEIVLAVFGFVAFMGLILMAELSYMLDYHDDILFAMVCLSLLSTAEVVWGTIFCVDFATRLKIGGWWKHTLIAACGRLVVRIVSFFGKAFIVLMRGLPSVAVVAIAFAGISFVELCVLVGAHRDFLLVMFLLEKLILFPVVLYLALVGRKLQAGSRALAEGDLNYKTDTSGMFLSFKEHGENLNKIGEGIFKAVAERMKSEHLKTELITNVSHDLKTPLTSIINYAELLNYETQRLQDAQTEGENSSANKKIAEYAEVLHRQSKRLKKLLEDLVEASKATTGALEVNLEPCEIGVLLSQAVGEYEQRFAEKYLNLIVRQPEEPVKIMADGRHLWRVFDNLLNNICKYAQENTRVYLSVANVEGQVQIIFRNMSKYALDEVTAEELEERFVRGDKSRHMEGNGLGLCIAKSLVELQNGRMELMTDGDLFKVTLYFQEI